MTNSGLETGRNFNSFDIKHTIMCVLGIWFEKGLLKTLTASIKYF
jgi:hypothetical protein